MRPTVIELPVQSYRPLDRVLTQSIPEPDPPEARCSHQGEPAVCVVDALVWIERWRSALAAANADRATAAAITASEP